jgi:DNA-binding transcriptional LysR family regulator
VAVSDVQRHIATLGQDTNGSIKLTCSTALAQRLMRSRLLDSFRTQYPAIEVELIMTERVLDLAKGEADIAIRGGKPADSQLIGKKITDVPWAIYASRSYVRKIGVLERANDFTGHNIIEFYGEIEHLPAARWLRTKARNCRVSGRASNLASVHLAVRSGVGLAPLPVPWADFDGDLVQISRPLPELGYPMYLVTHSDLMSVPRIAAFFAHCLEDLRPLLRDGVPSKGKKPSSSRSRR